MKGIRAVLRDNGGFAMIKPVAFLLIALITSVMIMRWIFIFTTVTGLADHAQQAVLQTAADNAFNAYKGVREGNSSAHIYAGSGVWNELVSTAEFTARLKSTLELKQSGTTLYRELADGQVQYRLSDIDVWCTNVALGADNSTTLTIRVKFVAELPIRFLDREITVRAPVDFNSQYRPLF